MLEAAALVVAAVATGAHRLPLDQAMQALLLGALLAVAGCPTAVGANRGIISITSTRTMGTARSANSTTSYSKSQHRVLGEVQAGHEVVKGLRLGWPTCILCLCPMKCCNFLCCTVL